MEPLTIQPIHPIPHGNDIGMLTAAVLGLMTARGAKPPPTAEDSSRPVSTALLVAEVTKLLRAEAIELEAEVACLERELMELHRRQGSCKAKHQSRGQGVAAVVTGETQVKVPVNPPTPSHKTFGTVAWFDVRRGFGFIKQDTTGSDVFVHRSSVWGPRVRGRVRRTLVGGERVGFCMQQSARGPKAVQVCSLGGIPAPSRLATGKPTRPRRGARASLGSGCRRKPQGPAAKNRKAVDRGKRDNITVSVSLSS